MNKTILGLKTEIKAKDEQIKQSDHSARLAALQKELAELRKEKENYDENIERMKNEFESAQAN